MVNTSRARGLRDPIVASDDRFEFVGEQQVAIPFDDVIDHENERLSQRPSPP